MNNIFHNYSGTKYRKDIQGIRAIGAILIMVYHIWFNKVSGGVDVFFVVSGFFMTGLLLRQYSNDGSLVPFKFWGKIIRRVAPSAYVVLLVTLIAGYFFISPSLLRAFVNEVLFSAVHLENFRLIMLSVDYLSQNNPPSPVQQYWALSMQIQFYVLLPILVFSSIFIAKKMLSIMPLVLVFSSFIVMSFFYSVYVTQWQPGSAYFNTGARLWEFLAGGLLAVILPFISVSQRFVNITGFVGLVSLLLVGIIVPESMSFPGYIALLPVIAALMLIISGSGSQVSTVSKILSNKYLVAIGGVSFTVYLWHWPILTFYQRYIDSTEVGFLAGLLIMLFSCFLAHATSKLIDTPVKKIGKDKIWVSYGIGVLFFAPVAISAVTLRQDIVSSQAERIAYWEQSEITQLVSMDAGKEMRANEIFFADFLAINKMHPESYVTGCHQELYASEVKTCEFGDTDSEVIVALVGGSHAAQWLPPLDEIGKNSGIKVINITKSGCPLGAVDMSPESCEEWNVSVLERLHEINPNVVVTNSTRAGVGGVDEFTPESYVEQWLSLSVAGIDVIGIRDNPNFGFDVPSCVYKNKAEPLVCSIEESSAYLPQDPSVEHANNISGFSNIDIADWFCVEGLCPPIFGNILIYKDSDHISVPFSLMLRYKLHEQLHALRPEYFSKPEEL